MKSGKNTDEELAQLLEQMRFEVAMELGLDGYREGYFGNATNAECGRFGHLLQQRCKQLLKYRRVPKN